MPEEKKIFKLETLDIEGVEIFSVGTWNGDPYNYADLTEMVRAFQATKDKFSPFLKISHDEAQKLAEKSGLSVDEFPALGWIDNLRMIGNSLVADFKNVPKKLAELMKVGAFRMRSAEIWHNIEFDGGVFPYMLKAVGLLGADAAAVSGLNTLDDIIALYSADKASAFKTNAEVKVYDLDFPALQESEMEKQVIELQAKLAESEKKSSELSVELKTMQDKNKELEVKLSGSQKEAESAKQEVAKHAKEKRSVEIKSKVDELIRSKKLSPAQKDFAVKLLEDGMARTELQFKAGDKEIKSADELLFALIEAGSGVNLNTELKADAGEAKREPQDGVVGIETDKKVQEYMEKNKGVSYREAYLVVSRDEKSK